MHNASAERVSNAFFIIQSLRTNMSACGAEVLLLESVRPIKSSNFRTRVPNKRLKGNTRSGKARSVHENGHALFDAPIRFELARASGEGACCRWTGLALQREAVPLLSD
jgi:hypothetical protein